MKAHPISCTSAPGATLLIRLAVGSIFVSEGIQKFINPADVGAGRFEKIGMPAPELLATIVGTTEIICGALVLLGLITRAAVIPLIAIMVVAIISTKVPILLGTDLGPFRVRQLSEYGFWSMMHESRTDLSMLLSCVFLAIVGAGPVSLDERVRPGDTP